MKKILTALLVVNAVFVCQPSNASSLLVKDLEKQESVAEGLANEGKYEEALKIYVDIYEKSHGDSSWAGVRNSFFLSRVLRMADNYPPTLDAFRKLRDQAGEKILKDEDIKDSMWDFSMLNKYLRENEKSVELYKQLKGKNPANAKKFATYILPSLVHSGDYADLHDAAVSEADWELERIPQLKMYGCSGPGLLGLIARRYPVFEILAATNEPELAKKMANAMLKVCRSKDNYEGLVFHAKRAGNQDLVAKLEEASVKMKLLK